MRAMALRVAEVPALPATVEAEDYMLIFAAEGVPYRPTHAHCFAAVVRVETAADQPPHVVDFRSLSWLPATMSVRALTLGGEKGRNVPLDETIQLCLAARRRIYLWGAYRVKPELAETFRARVITVESTFKYRPACFLSPRSVCDCVRSVEEMIEPRRRFIGVFGYGAVSASYIVRKFTPWLIEPQQSHRWVEPLLGLDRYPLIHRAFGDYTSWWEQVRSAFRWK
jgi:hypothetical protein